MKVVFVLMFSLSLFNCNNNKEFVEAPVVAETPANLFAMKTFEILESFITTNKIPSEDITATISIDENGYFNSRFSLKGKTLEQVKLGNFVAKSLIKDVECSSKWTCGKAIFACLENGDDALISEGACASSKTYCITCVKKK
tara:strand:- start:440 stop:865 length:426 start_codon:yes stop_codon:yes gene_type:complete